MGRLLALACERGRLYDPQAHAVGPGMDRLERRRAHQGPGVCRRRVGRRGAGPERLLAARARAPRCARRGQRTGRGHGVALVAVGTGNGHAFLPLGRGDGHPRRTDRRLEHHVRGLRSRLGFGAGRGAHLRAAAVGAGRHTLAPGFFRHGRTGCQSGPAHALAPAHPPVRRVRRLGPGRWRRPGPQAH